RHDYGLLRVKVVDAVSGQPLPDATLYRDAAAESLTTTADGTAVFAMDPGSHDVSAKLFGYSDASTVRSVALGGRDTVTIALAPLAKVAFSGTIRGQTPLEDAQISLL